MSAVAAANWTALPLQSAHHFETFTLLLLQGSTCLIRWGRRRCSGAATPCTSSASTRCWSTTSKRPCPIAAFAVAGAGLRLFRPFRVAFVLLPCLGWIITQRCAVRVCRFSCPICATSIFDMDKFFKALDAEVGSRESLDCCSLSARFLAYSDWWRLESFDCKKMLWFSSLECDINPSPHHRHNMSTLEMIYIEKNSLDYNNWWQL